MAFEYHHLDKWISANLDLAEEHLESSNKSVVVIGGASSSGKSFCANFLASSLPLHGHHAITISLDQYNHGLSGIIPNKVNLNAFDGKLEHLPEIKKAIHDIIVDVPFENKYGDDILPKIEEATKAYISKSDMPIFLAALKEEWLHVNFDEPSVYDLAEAAEDIKKLCNNESIEEKGYSKIISERMPTGKIIDGKDYDVIIVEGIYALDNSFLDAAKELDPITNFIESDPKSLFLRRIIRDAKSTSASTAFTVKLYFEFITKAYEETIRPSKAQAQVVLYNDMSFSELRSGDLYLSREMISIKDKAGVKYLKDNSTTLQTSHQKDFYFSVPNEKLENQNVLRFREISPDGGKTYVPGSLVHKGAPKIRKDGKVIRPINVLLNENEIQQVWKQNDEVIFDFLNNGFIISTAENKIKTKMVYKGQAFTLYEVEGKKAYLELMGERVESSIKELRKILGEKNK